MSETTTTTHVHTYAYDGPQHRGRPTYPDGLAITYGDGVEDAMHAALRALTGYVVALTTYGSAPAVQCQDPVPGQDVYVVRVEADALVVRDHHAPSPRTVTVLAPAERRVMLDEIERVHVY